MRFCLVLFGAIMALGVLALPMPAEAGPSHAIAMHGKPLYPENFHHFSFTNPDAPKGGTIRFAAVGTFDSLNPFIVRGTAAVGLREQVFESLMARGYDEPFSLYGLLAETIETPPDRSWVAFRLRPEARFSDGTPVTVDDVVYSLKTLRDKGRPNYRTYYSKVTRIERPDARTVKFILAPSGDTHTPDREMPLILGLMPIIPKHVYEKRSFDQSGLEAPVGSGPYVVDEVKPGARIAYRRDPKYWGRELAVNRGRYNIDRVIYDYYRDTNSSFEAFKAGLYDARPETDPGRWTGEYDFPAAKAGQVRKIAFETAMPSGMKALVFNTRRPFFADRRVRVALTSLFDFEWTNRTLYHNAYKRTESYFDNSELSSHARAASLRERELLAPFPDAVTPDIMARGYEAPVSEGSGQNRMNRQKALALLREAGYDIRDGKVVNAATNAPLSFEILVATPADERLALVYANMVRRAGIDARVRNVDASQYQGRLDAYDYDMIFYEWSQSLSPGNEQSFYWGSAAADENGTRNYMGVKSKAVDAMIEAMLAARTHEEFVAAVRALDRVLMAGNYVIPLFYSPTQWVALWNRVKVPPRISLYGYRIDAWWIGTQP
ncbi:MAG TPA: extracellular solute-binding protein [Parvibaculum sp.]|uniref:extracellular solute-binding protein n=1 Tax=Parvibaculum sp. TaxID=2024848 RepID=UPI002CF4D980|nr:extracellular solute-binding protein [Parvibaculum sp.]HMM14804.1 extracellular solute-binding protein [Parvibaculum sp.]